MSGSHTVESCSLFYYQVHASCSILSVKDDFFKLNDEKN